MVTDTGLRFKCAVVYRYDVSSVEIAEFSQTLQFGKPKRVTRSSMRDSGGFELASDVSFIGNGKYLNRSTENFIEMNMRASASVGKLNAVAMRRSVYTSYSLLGDLCGLQLLLVLDICLQ
jgi:hypothetical protein